MSCHMRFPTMWYVRPIKPQISLRIRAVWSEPLLVASIFYERWAIDWASFGDPKLKRMLHRLLSKCHIVGTNMLWLKCYFFYLGSLTPCMLDNLSCFYCCLPSVSKWTFFPQKILPGTLLECQNSLDPDQDRLSVHHDLGSKCLQQLSTDKNICWC